MFELSLSAKQLQNIEIVAAALDDRKIDIPLCNAVSWHSIFIDQGLVTNNGYHILSDVACSICDMVNIKWSIDDDTVDTVEAVSLGAKGAYASLIGTLVIVLHQHRAELQLINSAHVRSHQYRNLSAIVCRSLFQESQSEEEFSSPANCAPAIMVMEPSGSWSPGPLNA